MDEGTPELPTTCLEESGPNNELHPWISKLNLGADQIAVMDLKDSIIYT